MARYYQYRWVGYQYQPAPEAGERHGVGTRPVDEGRPSWGEDQLRPNRMRPAAAGGDVQNNPIAEGQVAQAATDELVQAHAIRVFGVPGGGLEPPRPCGHSALNAACLPIPPSRPDVARSYQPLSPVGSADRSRPETALQSAGSGTPSPGVASRSQEGDVIEDHGNPGLGPGTLLESVGMPGFTRPSPPAAYRRRQVAMSANRAAEPPVVGTATVIVASRTANDTVGA